MLSQAGWRLPSSCGSLGGKRGLARGPSRMAIVWGGVGGRASDLSVAVHHGATSLVCEAQIFFFLLFL